MLRVLTIMIVMSFIVACSSAKFISTGKSYPAKSDDCEIEIFTSKLPDRAYEELGIIEGEGSFGKDSFEDVLPKMKIEACRAGGDAIILLSSQKLAYGEDDFLNDDDKLSVTATVIKWKD